MARTVTCECGKRISVPAKSTQADVECPQCGEAVSLNGATPVGASLTFAVRKIGDKSKPPSSKSVGRIDFQCPDCGKDFNESREAAGKRTRCPKCAAEFVIPGETANSRPGSDSSETAQATKAKGVEQAVAAYNSGKIAIANTGFGKRGFITRRSVIPIGMLLIFLGGILTSSGVYLAAKGVLGSISLSFDDLGGAGDKKGKQELTQQGKALARLYANLSQEPANRQPGDDPIKQIVEEMRQKKKNEAKSDDSDSDDSENSGSSMLIWGTILGGLGSLLTFIGGIFLLAGLIGRFIEPVTVPPVRDSGDGEL